MYIVTIVALVMAASLGWFAYRMLREERRRADARVAVLTAALERTEPVGWDVQSRRDERATVTPRDMWTSEALPPAASGSIPGTAQMPELVFIEDDVRNPRAFLSEHDEWVDSAAHVAPHHPAGAVPLNAPLPATEDVAATPLRVGGLLGDADQSQRGDARGVIAAVGLILVAMLALGYWWWSSAPEARLPATASATRPMTPTAPRTVPLELTALGHEQRRGVLVVRGSVRNPVAGSDRRDLVANVALLDAAGSTLGSARAAVLAPTLRPGRDAEFSVQLPAHREVRRYRVTFLAADGSLVAHADRRAPRP